MHILQHCTEQHLQSRCPWGPQYLRGAKERRATRKQHVLKVEVILNVIFLSAQQMSAKVNHTSSFYAACHTLCILAQYGSCMQSQREVTGTDNDCTGGLDALDIQRLHVMSWFLLNHTLDLCNVKLYLSYCGTNWGVWLFTVRWCLQSFIFIPTL